MKTIIGKSIFPHLADFRLWSESGGTGINQFYQLSWLRAIRLSEDEGQRALQFAAS